MLRYNPPRSDMEPVGASLPKQVLQHHSTCNMDEFTLFVPFESALFRAKGAIMLPSTQHDKSIEKIYPYFERLPTDADSTKSTLLVYGIQPKGR